MECTLPQASGLSFDLSEISILPPKDFSGTAEFGVEVFTQESLLGIPTAAANLPSFQLHVVPVGDDVDTNPTDSVTGNEGQNIDIEINAAILDKELSASGSGIYSENAPETLRVEVAGVPQDASIYYPDGTTLRVMTQRHRSGHWMFQLNLLTRSYSTLVSITVIQAIRWALMAHCRLQCALPADTSADTNI